VENCLKANSNPESEQKRWGTPQGDLFPRGTAALSEEPAPLTARAKRSRARVWGRRLLMVIVVLFCIELGMALVVLPWLSVWTENSLLQNLPQARSFLSNFFVRGAFTGLGLIDIWIGVWEAVHYRDNPEV
jgi:hypothetical protein